MIGMELDAQMRSRTSAANDTTKPVSHEDLESQPRSDLSTVLFGSLAFSSFPICIIALRGFLRSVWLLFGINSTNARELFAKYPNAIRKLLSLRPKAEWLGFLKMLILVTSPDSLGNALFDTLSSALSNSPECRTDFCSKLAATGCRFRSKPSASA